MPPIAHIQRRSYSTLIMFILGGTSTLLLTACSTMQAAPRYTADATNTNQAIVRELKQRQQATPKRLQRVVNSYIGVPYKWGGTTRQGMDCSALVRAVYREAYGIELPRTSKQMFLLGQPIDNQPKLRAGDLVFFRISSSGPGVSHVGIYMGKGRFAHASASKGGIIVAFNQPYFQDHYAGARRIRP